MSCEYIRNRQEVTQNQFNSRSPTVGGTVDYDYNLEYFEFAPVIRGAASVVRFKNCGFSEGVNFKNLLYTCEVTFENCDFCGDVTAIGARFDQNVRFHNCNFYGDKNLRETTFNKLADFWSSTFYTNQIFYKTDFKATAVFSMAIFHEDVLFTYALLAGKFIFSRTKFIMGLDLSQAIISGDLKLFDLKFTQAEFEAQFYGEHDLDYQDAIDRGYASGHKESNFEKGTLLKIPMTNKVHTFQILKHNFEKVGDFADSTIMRRNEKLAMRELNNARLPLNTRVNWFLRAWKYLVRKLHSFFKSDTTWKELKSNDGFILFLNRWSNNYGTDFWKGVRFTVKMALVFSAVTLILTKGFWNHVCVPCDVDWGVFSKGIGFFFNFLNPARRISDLSQLKPFLGIAYVFDFLGRIAVGYGIYQTIQAFRKFK
jgi:hypothetical protein